MIPATFRYDMDELLMNGSSDNLSQEVQKKVLDAFEVFDHEQNKTVDSREIGTIVRSLGNFLFSKIKGQNTYI